VPFHHGLLLAGFFQNSDLGYQKRKPNARPASGFRI